MKVVIVKRFFTLIFMKIHAAAACPLRIAPVMTWNVLKRSLIWNANYQTNNQLGWKWMRQRIENRVRNEGGDVNDDSQHHSNTGPRRQRADQETKKTGFRKQSSYFFYIHNSLI